MMWLRSVWLGVTEMRTKPNAKRVVKTIPIAASSLTATGVTDQSDQRYGDQPEDQGPDSKWCADDVSEDNTRQHGVRDGVAHQRPPDEHQPTT